MVVFFFSSLAEVEEGKQVLCFLFLEKFVQLKTVGRFLGEYQIQELKTVGVEAHQVLVKSQV